MPATDLVSGKAVQLLSGPFGMHQLLAGLVEKNRYGAGNPGRSCNPAAGQPGMVAPEWVTALSADGSPRIRSSSGGNCAAGGFGRGDDLPLPVVGTEGRMTGDVDASAGPTCRCGSTRVSCTASRTFTCRCHGSLG